MKSSLDYFSIISKCHTILGSKTGDRPDVNIEWGSLQTSDLLPLRPKLPLESLFLDDDRTQHFLARTMLCGVSRGRWRVTAGQGPLCLLGYAVLLFLASGAPSVSQWECRGSPGGALLQLCTQIVWSLSELPDHTLTVVHRPRVTLRGLCVPHLTPAEPLLPLCIAY